MSRKCCLDRQALSCETKSLFSGLEDSVWLAGGLLVLDARIPDVLVDALGAGDDRAYVACRRNFALTKTTDDSLPSERDVSDCSKFSEDDQLELVGSPLQCPFDPNSTFVSGSEAWASDSTAASRRSLLPLSLDESVELISKYWLMDDDERPALPICVLCDGKDAEKTILLASIKTQKLVCEVKGSLIGPQEKKIASLEQLMKRYHGEAEVKCSGYASYDVLGTGNEIPSKFQIEMTWKKVEGILERPPLGSTMQLRIRSIPGDVHGTSPHLWRDLEKLAEFVGFLKSGETEWTNEEDETESLTGELLGLLVTDGREEGARTPKRESDDLRPGSGLERLNIYQRASSDFTDRAWEMLKKCRSLQHLRDCFNALFKEAQLGRIRAQQLSRDKCKLTQLISSCITGRCQSPPLDGLQPLELLVDLGLMKLQKDYSYIFTVGELVVPGRIHAFLGAASEWEEKLTCLKKLHHILEVVNLCQTFLAVPQNVLQDYCSLLLQHYRANKLHFEHEFTLQLPTILPAAVLDRFSLVMWKLTTKSSAPDTKAICCFTKDLSTLPWLSNKEKVPDDSDAYFMTVLHSITSPF